MLLITEKSCLMPGYRAPSLDIGSSVFPIKEVVGRRLETAEIHMKHDYFGILETNKLWYTPC